MTCALSLPSSDALQPYFRLGELALIQSRLDTMKALAAKVADASEVTRQLADSNRMQATALLPLQVVT